MLDNYLKYMKDIVYSLEGIKNRKKLVQMLKGNKILIYGAGNVGTIIYDMLHGVSLEAVAFFDKKVELITCRNKRIYRVEENSVPKDFKKDSVVIVAFNCNTDQYLQMKNYLQGLGYSNVCFYQDIYYLFQTGKPYILGENLPDVENMKGVLKIHSDKGILRIPELLADEESRVIYSNFLKAAFFADSTYLSQPTAQVQYFVTDIPFKKGYSRFIDCGAFDGDTGILLRQLKGEIDSIVFFEPDPDNFRKLNANIERIRVAKEQILYPCGTWDRSKMLHFNSGKLTSSGISEQGDSWIQCVAIDEVLRDFKPTFIKMDVEGAEYEALLGAKNVINTCKPDLAISLYHKVEHMWEIPLLINSFEQQYEFYIRTHGLHGMETILYAVCKEM